jgi:hypothetical protein
VSYREKRGILWPVSRRVKSAETLVVFPNLGWVLYITEDIDEKIEKGMANEKISDY